MRLFPRQACERAWPSGARDPRPAPWERARASTGSKRGGSHARNPADAVPIKPGGVGREVRKDGLPPSATRKGRWTAQRRAFGQGDDLAEDRATPEHERPGARVRSQRGVPRGEDCRRRGESVWRRDVGRLHVGCRIAAATGEVWPPVARPRAGIASRGARRSLHARSQEAELRQYERQCHHQAAGSSQGRARGARLLLHFVHHRRSWKG